MLTQVLLVCARLIYRRLACSHLSWPHTLKWRTIHVLWCHNNETLTLLFVPICKFAIFISVFCFRISLRKTVFLLILALKRLLRENIVVNLWIKCLFSFEHLVLKWPCMEEDFVGPPGLRNWFLPNISITYIVWYFSHPLAYGTVHVVSHLIALGLFWIRRY